MANQVVEGVGGGRKVVIIGGGIAGSYIAKSLQFIGSMTLIHPYVSFLFPTNPTFVDNLSNHTFSNIEPNLTSLLLKFQTLRIHFGIRT